MAYLCDIYCDVKDHVILEHTVNLHLISYINGDLYFWWDIFVKISRILFY